MRDLVANGSLIDVLSNTEDPNGDAQSPVSLASNTLRENAALSVNKLVGSAQVSQQAVLTALLNLDKDSDSAVQTDAINGLTAFAKQSDGNLTLPDIRLHCESWFASIVDLNDTPWFAVSPALAKRAEGNSNS